MKHNTTIDGGDYALLVFAALMFIIAGLCLGDGNIVLMFVLIALGMGFAYLGLTDDPPKNNDYKSQRKVEGACPWSGMM
jgi:hypothetical protein